NIGGRYFKYHSDCGVVVEVLPKSSPDSVKPDAHLTEISRKLLDDDKARLDKIIEKTLSDSEGEGHIVDNSVTIINDGVGNLPYEMFQKNADIIYDMLKDYEFSESSSDCLYDYVVNIGGRHLLYHSDCGTLTELTFTGNSVCAMPSCMKETICKLGDNDRQILNEIIIDTITKDIGEGESFKAKIIKFYENSMLVATTEKNTSADLVVVPCENKDNLHEGDEVKIVFDGYYMESYPAQIAKPKQVLLIRRGDNLAGLYLDVITDLLAHDMALNENAELIALDLDMAENLTPAEKNAVAQLVWEQQGVYCITLSKEQLEKDGYIKEGHFEKGVLISVSDFEYAVCEPNFKFNICKYKAPLAAYMFTDVVVTMSEDIGTYKYEIGAHAIS
ncbi:MAG: hypothetical protein IJC83_02880, partial [Oscillospiraceae bacterium]|nr:hypothetical protein [Oscillospiraceae bacterium]